MEMLKLHFLDGNHKGQKSWSITSCKKGSKRKKYYISDDLNYEKYIQYKGRDTSK
jgi:hypothetical protein